MSDLQQTESSRSATQKHNTTSEQPKDWTIKGLPAKTVEITREAAKQNGMKLNAWINKALHDAAAEVQYEGFTAAPQSDYNASSANDELVRLRKQNDELVHTINSMTAILAKMYAEKS